MLINGKPADAIDYLDRGFQYGDGLFETVAVVEGRPCLWPRHMVRLRQGCERLGIPMPDSALLLEEATQVIADHTRTVLKIIITRGAGGRGYRPPQDASPNRMLYTTDWPDHPPEASRLGIMARICSTRLGHNPLLAGIKHLNRLEQVMAQSEWQDSAVAEGLMLDSEGQVIEGTMSNLFMFDQGRLLTPNLGRCGTLGVMRGLVLDIASNLDIPVAIEDIALEEIWEADALFLCNSLIGIWPIHTLGEREYGVEAIPPALIEAVMAQGFRP